MKFPVLPVTSLAGATLDFQKLQKWMAEREESPYLAFRAAAQNIGEGWTLIKIDTIIKDPGGNTAPVTPGYRVPAAGYYHIDGSVEVRLKAGAIFLVGIYVNGTLRLLGDRTDTGPESEYAGSVGGLLDCSKGDNVELWGYADKVSPLLIGNAEATNRINVVRVA